MILYFPILMRCCLPYCKNQDKEIKYKNKNDHFKKKNSQILSWVSGLKLNACSHLAFSPCPFLR